MLSARRQLLQQAYDSSQPFRAASVTLFILMASYRRFRFRPPFSLFPPTAGQSRDRDFFLGIRFRLSGYGHILLELPFEITFPFAGGVQLFLQRAQLGQQIRIRLS